MKRSALSSFAAIAIVIANLAVVLAVVNGSIARKQAIVESGTRVFLKLAPVDPRSLMQGDYMVLNYALNRDKQLQVVRSAAPTRGRIILKRDERGVGTFERIEEAEESGADLLDSEILLEYRKSRRGFRFGIESFFFEEGDGGVYRNAKYAELRVSPEGIPVLVDLRGDDLRELVPGELRSDED